MARLITALAAGLLFGLGLAVGQMTDPAKVLAFLDITGAWDPSLALVMAAALAVTFVGYRLILPRPKPLLDTQFHLPTRRRIDGRLVVGSALFGAGWGLVGFCPGPALASLALDIYPAVIFVAAMLAGAWLQQRTDRPSLLGARLAPPAGTAAARP